MHDTEIEAQVSLDELVQNLDKAVEGKPGIKPSEAWRYREEVRAKYRLPECGYKFEDPVRYIQTIEEFLKENDIEVKNKHELSLFFRENPEVEAVSLANNVFRNSAVVAQNASDNDWFRLRTRAKQLAHESVHALQDKYYPGMPNNVAEKEAFYYQMVTPQMFFQFSTDPNYVMHFINKIMEDNIAGATQIDNKINR